MLRRAAVAPLLVTACLSAFGDPAPNLHFERIGSTGGPPPEVITALLQDRDGFIWIGSRNGLLLFDGYSYTKFQYDPSDPGSLSDSTIRTIYADRDGTIWVGTNTGGLNRFDPATRSFVHYRHDSADPGSLSHDSVYAILRDRTGRLWVGTQKGLNRLDPGEKSFVRFAAGGSEGLVNDFIITLYEDRAGRLWAGTLGGGLHRWDDAARRFEVFRHDAANGESLADDRISSLLEDDAGRLWVGTLEGLSRMDVDRREFLSFRQEPVTALAPGPPGKIWVGTLRTGLDEIDTDTGLLRGWQHDPNRPDSLSENTIIALLSDRDGSLWIGTWGGGLERLSHASQRFSGPGDAGFPPAGVPARDVTSMLRARDGRIWIGTRSGYLVRWDPANRRYESILVGGSEGEARIVIDMAEDRLGRIWIGASDGLLRLDPSTGEKHRYTRRPDDPRSLGPGYVTAVFVDSSGTLWVGTGEGGLQRVDETGAVVQRFVHDPNNPASLSDDFVTTLIEDRQGRLWIGTRSGGLNELDTATGRARRFQPVAGDPSSLGHHCVTALLEDSIGRLWVGTAGGGLNRIVRSEDGAIRFDRVDKNLGLVDDDVTGVLEDDDHSLWVATRNGLSRFQPERNAFTNLLVSDGLPAAEFEPNAAVRSRGTLFFGTVRGLVALPAGTSFETPSRSPVVVRSIRTASGEMFGRRGARAPDRLEIRYGAWLSVELAVLDFSPERDHRYAYRLDDDWVDLGESREITFTSLQPGIHALRVRGRNSQGVWSETEAPLRVTVVPPYWMTWPFRLLMLSLVVTVVLAMHWRRTSVLERRNRELLELHRQREKARQDLDDAYQRLRRLTRGLEAAKEDERQRIARELHDEMGPSLTAVIINLQLLPKQKGAERTARKIADTVDLVDRMVQRVRDISLDLRPPLIDELGLVPALSGYLESVSERTGIRIRIRGDQDLGPLPADVPITAFRVVQEAVTNAIRHSGAVSVDVSVRRNGARLDLDVEDDGRGFDVGDTMERAAVGKSLGLLGMKERVGMLSGEIEIDSAPGTGTRVRVHLPVVEAA
jgi:signal transduction histidine kinase/ligand-binding sensor domain-containing protein